MLSREKIYINETGKLRKNNNCLLYFNIRSNLNGRNEERMLD